jgi:hypothetical protein
MLSGKRLALQFGAGVVLLGALGAPLISGSTQAGATVAKAKTFKEETGPAGATVYASDKLTAKVKGKIKKDTVTLVACKVNGTFDMATGSSWWYKLPTGTYVPSGDFWNGPVNGANSFPHDPYVDSKVATCKKG